MQLQLTVEQTVDFTSLAALPQTSGLRGLALPRVQVGDTGLALTPTLSLFVKNSTHDTIKFSSSQIVFGNPSVIYFKVTVGHYEPNDGEEKSQEAEGYICLDGKDARESREMCRVDISRSNDYSKLTIHLEVYARQSSGGARPRPARLPSSGLHQARLSGAFTDMVVVVDGAELPAHRVVLAARSPVLATALSGEFKEASEARIHMIDVSKETAKNFLEFLYDGQINSGCRLIDVLDMLKLADKYMVPDLREYCSAMLCGFGPVDALRLLRAAGAGPTDLLGRRARRRLTATVLGNLPALTHTEQFKQFKKSQPVLFESMLANYSPMCNSFVWPASGGED